MFQLPIDCILEIFEYLEDYPNTLISCLLVNRSWCEIGVRIYWRQIRNYTTLIDCLPNESKKRLQSDGISIFSPIPPTFPYASFCKDLSITEVNIMTTE